MINIHLLIFPAIVNAAPLQAFLACQWAEEDPTPTAKEDCSHHFSALTKIQVKGKELGDS